jgi:hypothetical protein
MSGDRRAAVDYVEHWMPVFGYLVCCVTEHFGGEFCVEYQGKIGSCF